MHRIRTAPDGPSETSVRMLDALNLVKTSGQIYQGTARAGEVARRHAANRAAKAARRAHRRSSK